MAAQQGPASIPAAPSEHVEMMQLPPGMPTPTEMVGGGFGMPSGSMSIGSLPPLNVDQGPSNPIASVGDTSSGGQTTRNGNGDFVFKGAQAGSLLGTVQGLLPVVIVGGLALLAYRRFG